MIIQLRKFRKNSRKNPLKWCTPQKKKSNISPEDWWLEDDSFPFKNGPGIQGTNSFLDKSFPSSIDDLKASYIFRPNTVDE